MSERLILAKRTRAGVPGNLKEALRRLDDERALCDTRPVLGWVSLR